MYIVEDEYTFQLTYRDVHKDLLLSVFHQSFLLFYLTIKQLPEEMYFYVYQSPCIVLNIVLVCICSCMSRKAFVISCQLSFEIEHHLLQSIHFDEIGRMSWIQRYIYWHTNKEVVDLNNFVGINRADPVVQPETISPLWQN